MGQKSKVSPIIFIASILCFLFPFIAVSCGGQRFASFSGIQLATGTTVDQPQMFGPSQKKKVAPDPFAAVAGLCAIVALGLSFVGSARTSIAPAISGATGAISLLLMKSRMDSEIVKQGQGILRDRILAGITLPNRRCRLERLRFLAKKTGFYCRFHNRT